MDFNSIITAALTAAIEQVTAPLVARITELEAQARIERGTSCELTNRIDTLSSQHVAMGQRIDRLVDSGAQTAQTTSPVTLPDAEPGNSSLDQVMRSILLLEQRMVNAESVLGAVFENATSERTLQAIREGDPDGLRLAEQMVYRVSQLAVTEAERSMESHLEEHDHGDFATKNDIDKAMENHTSEYDHDEFVTEIDEDSLRGAVSDLLSNATISV